MSPRTALVCKADSLALIWRLHHHRGDAGGDPALALKPLGARTKGVPPTMAGDSDAVLDVEAGSSLGVSCGASAPSKTLSAPPASTLTFPQAPTTHILLQQRKQKPPLLRCLPWSLCWFLTLAVCEGRSPFPTHLPCAHFIANPTRTTQPAKAKQTKNTEGEDCSCC